MKNKVGHDNSFNLTRLQICSFSKQLNLAASAETGQPVVKNAFLVGEGPLTIWSHNVLA